MAFYETEYYQSLKIDIAQRAELSMQHYSDCLLLSDRMESEGITLSPHTIARFFGFLPHRKFYPATLYAFCNYLGFESFESYKIHKQHSRKDSLLIGSSFFLNPTYSKYSFQIAIEHLNSKWINQHLEVIDNENPEIEELAHLTGFLVRKSIQKKKLLDILIQQEKGRCLFYERFVDEDDPDNYFSEALKANYLAAVKTPNNQLFYFTYLISNAIYKSKYLNTDWIVNFNKLILSIDFKQLHFHEFSRLIEVKMLLSSESKKNTSITALLDWYLSEIKILDSASRSWCLARILKSLSYTKHLNIFLNNQEALLLLDNTYFETNVSSIGELIVQYFYFLFTDSGLNLRTPRVLTSGFTDNEYATRLCVESATRLLFSSEPEKSVLFNYLKTYCRSSGNQWVINSLLMAKKV